MAHFTPLSSSVYQVSLWLVYEMVPTRGHTLGVSCVQTSLGMTFHLLDCTLNLGLMPLEIVGAEYPRALRLT